MSRPRRLPKLDRRLRTLFYNPALPTSFRGDPTVYYKATGANSPQAKKRVLYWLEKQPAWSLHRSIRKKFRRRRFITHGINYIWSVDLCDFVLLKRFNDNYAYILVVIDTFSKRLEALPLKKKTPDQIILAFETLLNNSDPTLFHRPLMVNSDMGGEFGKKFTHYLRSKGIHHYYAKNPPIKASIAERSIRTLKAKLYRYFTHVGGNPRWIDVLPSIVHAYNRTKHSSIQMTPLEATLDNQDRVRYNLYGVSSINELVNPETVFKRRDRLAATSYDYTVGDYVRITKHKNILNQKSYTPSFTKEIFVIVAKNPINKRRGSERVLYRLEDLSGEPIEGSFYAEELSRSTAAPQY